MHKGYFPNYNCWIKDNRIRFANMTTQRLIPEFINSVGRLVYKFNHKKIVLDFEEVDAVFPLPIVPIISYIDFFKNEENIDFEFINLSGYLKHINVYNPNSAEKLIENNALKCLDKIWYFDNSDHVHALSSLIIRDIRRAIICEVGILDACRWGINEMMDNVIQHSQIKRGFVMAQIQKSNNSINICVFDYGIGIFKSLRRTEHNPKNAIDAIMLCVKEGVTRDKEIGQGNGLWGLFNMVAQNNGYLSIISGKGGIKFKNKGQDLDTFKDVILLNKTNQATTVNFHLYLNRNISIKDAIGGHEIIDMFVEDMHNDYDQIEYKIDNIASGTGTRESAIQIRNELVNIYKKYQKKIIIDFSNIGIISSSFADELLCKLIVDYGMFQFQRIFEIKNMNKNIQTIFDKSLTQRLKQQG